MSMSLLFLKATQTFLVTAKVVENRLLCTYHVIQLINLEIFFNLFFFLTLEIFDNILNKFCITGQKLQYIACLYQSNYITKTLVLRPAALLKMSLCRTKSFVSFGFARTAFFVHAYFLKKCTDFHVFWNLWIWITKHGTMDKHHHLVSQNHKESGP